MYVSPTRQSFIAIGIATCLALLAGHEGDAWRAPVLVGCALLAGWSLREPSVGLLAALPLLLIIHPTPASLGWREMAFAGVLVAGGLAALWHGRGLLLQGFRRFYWLVLIASALLILNAATAYIHGVGVADWLRGLAPFVFILYVMPAYLELTRDKRFLGGWLLALMSAAALFALEVIRTFVSLELWKPHIYRLDGTTWIRIDPAASETQSEPTYEFMARVTQLLQQSTDLLLPLGCVIGAWMVLVGGRRVKRLGGSVLLVASTAAMTLTYTRSMLISAAFAVSLLLLYGVRIGVWRRSLSVVALVVLALASTIVSAELKDIYSNRIFLLKQAITSAPAVGSPSIADSPNIADSNVTSRLEEYAAAWAMFRSSPIFGQGLGVKHTIAFDQGHGKVLLAHVGYIHNWVLYFLMVGGVVGFLAYTLVLIGPALLAWRTRSLDAHLSVLIGAVVLLMMIYALFFAVFRLIPFNLALGGIWAAALHQSVFWRRHSKEG